MTATQLNTIKELILKTVNAYTYNPKSLDVDTYTPTPDILIVQLRTEKSDHRKLIGKFGVSVKALKGLFEAIGKRVGVGVDLRIREPYDYAEEPPKTDFDTSDTFDARKPQALIETLVYNLTGNRVWVETRNSNGRTEFVLPSSGVGLSDEDKANLRVIVELIGNRNRRQFELYA